MEDMLEGSRRPHEPRRPLVCSDAASTQPVQETRAPFPRKAGKPARDDSAYDRHGVRTLCMPFAPLEGWRHVEVTDRRPSVDCAHGLNAVVDGHVPDAERMVFVSDNVHTHKPAALYEAFAPEDARRIMEKLAWHDPPKQGSWLDMAESELRVLQPHCLARRIPDQETLQREVAAWERERNQPAVQANWRFTTADARIKLKKLYPSF